MFPIESTVPASIHDKEYCRVICAILKEYILERYSKVLHIPCKQLYKNLSINH